MCKHWDLHISTNINCLGTVLGSFWAVWKGLLWCLKAKLRSWRFPRYWQFNKRYHGGYQLICLISRPILIASRHDWYQSKGLLEGFKLALRPWESLKNWWRYGQMKFVTPFVKSYSEESVLLLVLGQSQGCYSKSRWHLSSDITSLKTLTRSSTKEHEDIKC